MPTPPVYLDECMDVALIEPLRQRGFRVTSAQLERQRGLENEEQLRYAEQHGFLIVSENKKHFRRWHRDFQRRGEPHAGIVTVPKTEASLQELRIAMLLAWIGLQAESYRSRLFVWGELQNLLEQGLRLPGFADAEIQRAIGQS